MSRAPRQGAWAVLRLLAFLAVGCLLACAWLATRAHAYGERVLSQFGEHMMHYTGAVAQSAPQPLRMNGATFFASAGTVDASVHEVLDRFHAKCLTRNGGLHALWSAAAGRGHYFLKSRPALMDGVFRSETEQSGVLACIETGATRMPAREFVTRIERVFATGEITNLGNLRYVYAMRDRQRTGFAAVWSEGSLNYKRMFPATGDAPGSDPRGVPRPPHTRRLLSTQAPGTASSLNVYRSELQSADALVAFYAEHLPQAGFALLTPKRKFMAAHDGTRMLTISVRTDTSTGHAIATVATQPD